MTGEAAAGIDAFGVVKRRGDQSIVIDALRLAPGAQLALVGPSGCGKSTTLDLLAGILPPDQAMRLRVGAFDLAAGTDATAWRARHLGYVLQTGGMIASLSVRDNILLPRRLLGLPRAGDATVLELATRLGLAETLTRSAAKISIGQRQRAAILRAVAHDPDWVLADEPTAALDPARAEETMALLVALSRRRGFGLLVVTHDEDLAAAAGLPIRRCRVEGQVTHIDVG